MKQNDANLERIMSTTKSSTPDAVQHRRWRTFSINTMMFVVLCAAVVLGGYRFGYDRGSATGQDLSLSEECYVKTYYVGDLAGAPGDPTEYGGDYDTLICVIQETIVPAEWDIVGGEGSIQPVQRVHSIVISQTGAGHDEIEKLLARLREIAEEHDIDLTQPYPPLPHPAFPIGGGGSTGGLLPETTEPNE